MRAPVAFAVTFAAFALAGASPVQDLGRAPAAQALQVPYLTGPVVDEAGLLDADTRTRVETVLRSLRREGAPKGHSPGTGPGSDGSGAGFQMQVYIPASLADLPIEEFSIRVAESWKIGRKGEDRGLLLVIAPHERKMRFEVGYGLEGEITDAFAKHVLDDVLKPYFRDQRYGDGILAATGEIARKLGVDASATAVSPARGRGRSSGIPIPGGLLIFLLLPLVFFLVMAQMRSEQRGLLRRRGGGFGGWGGFGGGWGGGGGGGGWGGGGGGFGGGGSSSSW